MSDIDYNATKINLIKHENIEGPGIHLKSVAREADRKEKWENELIRISILDNDNNERPGCTWRLPRHKCTPDFLQEIINRSPAAEDPDGCLIEFLRDSAGVDLIWPDRMQQDCNPKPFSYYVVKKFVTEAYDAKEDAHYSGDLRVMLKNVPMKTVNERYSVQMEDVRAWVLAGVIEEDSFVQKYVKKVDKLKKAMDIMTKRIKTTASQPVYDDRGKEIFGETADKEREDRYLDMSREREKIEEEHDHARHEVEIAMSQRIASKLTLKRGNVDEASSKCTWVLHFSGINKARFENLVAHKTDWNGIRLAVGWQGRPPYTCRGTMPDGSKPFIPDLRDFLVNMHGIRVTRLEDGFGTFQELDRQSTDIRGKRFQFYHGTFKEGLKHGYGIWYTDEGIYSGQIKDNQPQGKGRMDYANGDSCTGEFKVSRGHKESLIAENPYARGEPNGKCSRTFSDGSFYEGEMKDGKVHGEGSYINAMGERYDGGFKNGYFHGKGKFITVAGEVLEGDFDMGLLHGYGSLTNSRNDRYEGAFDFGEKHGKGMEVFNNGNQFIGFYQDGLRLWHGEMYYGNVKEKKGSRGETMLQFDCKHEGPWRAGMMRSNGCVTYSVTRNVWPSINKRHPRYPFLSNLKDKEDQANKRQNKHKKKAYDIDRMLRKEIERKKTKVFQQQRHLAKKNMYYASEFPDGLTDGVLEGATAYRKSRIENMVNKQLKVAEAPKSIEEADINPGLNAAEAKVMKRKVPRLFLASQELEKKVLEEVGEQPKHTILSKLLQSDFEEMEERRHFINIDRTTSNITNMVDVMYKKMNTIAEVGEGGDS